jgi:hypothetical protein
VRAELARAPRRGCATQSLNPTRAAPLAVRELEPPGEFSSTRSYAFEFNNVEMPYESYNGVNVRLKCVSSRCGLCCRACAD